MGNQTPCCPFCGYTYEQTMRTWKTGDGEMRENVLVQDRTEHLLECPEKPAAVH